MSEDQDPSTPPTGPAPEPSVVGIGASAGGLAALKTFFSRLPPKTGMAYVVVVHLSPQHESHLTELLQPHCPLPIQQVSETVALERDHVYVIPPNANLEAVDTHLRLTEMPSSGRGRTPIDHFFRTVAETFDGSAIGVILSGTGTDGTLGLRQIKAKGGLTIAQDPNESEFDGMPQSAIAADVVDQVLPIAEIPRAIVAYHQTKPRVEISDESEEADARQRQLLQKVFAQLRARTGREFSRYKRSTILRRIRRRMQINRVEELPRYVELLRDQPDEVRMLGDDLLINVTNFFRDAEVFDFLATEVIPRLFEDKRPEEEIRVWSVGCATGEEAYSLAILLLEEAARRDTSPRIQVFASDLHEPSLARAREGFFAGDIESDVSPERLRRFFQREDGGYRIRKEVRERVLFASHNLLSDPPFSRMDIVSCRNLLIYLQREVQRDVIDIFHYSLLPEGTLVVGTSESVDAADLFRVVDKKLCVFQRRSLAAGEPKLPVFPLTLSWPRARDPRGRAAETTSYGALHQELVERFAPPSVLINGEDRIVHLSQQAGRYLVHPGGEPTASLQRSVREELRMELQVALEVAKERGTPTRTKPVLVHFNGDAAMVAIQVRPAAHPEHEGYRVVTFEEGPPIARPAEAELSDDPLAWRVAELEAELHIVRQRLQGTVEESETTQEEIRASNEELQSANEELRSTMEELETSKEELQSTNEELQTVNEENRHKVEELAQLTGDLQNLLAATEIATLFLDRQLRIMRFTPRVGDLFSVRTTDRGRPITELRQRIGYPELQADARRVVETLVPVERELEDETGQWYLTRVLPYRSAEDRIEGVVLTFVDITGRKQAEAALKRLTETLEERVRDRTDEVQRREEQVRRLVTTLTMAEQEERRRISQLLHDDLQQLLYGIQMRMSLARDEAAGGDTAALIAHTDRNLELLTEAIDTTRRLTVDLSPPVLQGEGLADALHWLRSHMRELYDLDVEIRTDGDVPVPSNEMRTLLFRIVRELLFNVTKHAGTKRAEVVVDQLEGRIRIVVADEGKGFDAAGLQDDGESLTGFGLFSVLERLRFAGGEMEIDSGPGGGTRITIYAPVTASTPSSALRSEAER